MTIADQEPIKSEFRLKIEGYISDDSARREANQIINSIIEVLKNHSTFDEGIIFGSITLDRNSPGANNTFDYVRVLLEESSFFKDNGICLVSRYSRENIFHFPKDKVNDLTYSAPRIFLRFNKTNFGYVLQSVKGVIIIPSPDQNSVVEQAETVLPDNKKSIWITLKNWVGNLFK